MNLSTTSAVSLLIIGIISAQDNISGEDSTHLPASSDSKYSVEILEPFPDDSDFIGIPYRIANFLHINSYPWTVRRLYPLKSGEKLDSLQIADAERILRAYSFWSDAKIAVKRDSTLDKITVNELWTTKASASVSYLGELEWSLFLEEENFFGFGAYITAGYGHYIERDWWTFGSIVYGLPIHGTNWEAIYNRHRDEWSIKTGIGHFESQNPDDNCLSDFSFQGININKYLYLSGGEISDTLGLEEYKLSSEFLRKADTHYGGVSIGLIWKELKYPFGFNPSIYSLQFIEPQSEFTFIPMILRYSNMSRKFVQMQNVNNFNRVEDIPIGYHLTLGLGGTIKSNIFDNGSGTGEIRGLEQIYISQLSASAIEFSTYFAASVGYRKFWDKTLANFRAKVFVPANVKSFVRLGFGLDYYNIEWVGQYNQLCLDGRTGLRGFSAFYNVSPVDEAEFFKFTAELRVYPELEVCTIRPGFALFCDIGRLTEIETEYLSTEDGDILLDIGLSLQICSTRSTVGNINRLDISYNPQTKAIGFTIDSGQMFSFFFPMAPKPLLSN